MLAGAVLPEVRHDDHQFPCLDQQDHSRHRGENLNDLGQEPQRVGELAGSTCLPKRVSEPRGVTPVGRGVEHTLIRQGADGERYGHLLFAAFGVRCTGL